MIIFFSQRHDVCNIFSVGPRFKLFDGLAGIKQYVAPTRVYIVASDGRLLHRASGGAVDLIDSTLVQGGSARVCSRPGLGVVYSFD